MSHKFRESMGSPVTSYAAVAIYTRILSFLILQCTLELCLYKVCDIKV